MPTDKIFIDVEEIALRPLKVAAHVDWETETIWTEYPLQSVVLKIHSIVVLEAENKHLTEFEIKLFELIFSDVNDSDYFNLFNQIESSIEQVSRYF
jgi:hypothetical protein